MANREGKHDLRLRSDYHSADAARSVVIDYGERPKTFRAGKFCRIKKCHKVLSIYNRYDVCHSCLESKITEVLANPFGSKKHSSDLAALRENATRKAFKLLKVKERRPVRS